MQYLQQRSSVSLLRVVFLLWNCKSRVWGPCYSVLFSGMPEKRVERWSPGSLQKAESAKTSETCCSSNFCYCTCQFKHPQSGFWFNWILVDSHSYLSQSLRNQQRRDRRLLKIRKNILTSSNFHTTHSLPVELIIDAIAIETTHSTNKIILLEIKTSLISKLIRFFW